MKLDENPIEHVHIVLESSRLKTFYKAMESANLLSSIGTYSPQTMLSGARTPHSVHVQYIITVNQSFNLLNINIIIVHTIKPPY